MQILEVHQHTGAGLFTAFMLHLCSCTGMPGTYQACANLVLNANLQ